MMHRNARAQFDTIRFAAGWGLMYALAFATLFAVVPFLIEQVHLPYTLANITGGLLAGIALGASGLLLVRRQQQRILEHWLWLSSVGGLVTGFAVSAFAIFLLSLSRYFGMPDATLLALVLPGIALSQWQSLRLHSSQAGRWVALHAAGALATLLLAPPLLPVGLVVALVYGLAAGLLMRYLLRDAPQSEKPKRQPDRVLLYAEARLSDHHRGTGGTRASRADRRGVLAARLPRHS